MTGLMSKSKRKILQAVKHVKFDGAITLLAHKSGSHYNIYFNNGDTQIVSLLATQVDMLDVSDLSKQIQAQLDE